MVLAQALVALHGTLLFFCSGHFSEFAGLHYTAGALLLDPHLTHAC